MASKTILIITTMFYLYYLPGCCTGIMEQKLILESNNSLVCLEVYGDPESQTTVPEVTAELIVASNGGYYQQFTAGESNIDNKDLIPGLHKITIMHAVVDRKHSLSIFLDDKLISFTMEKQPRWVTSYDFQSVIIMTDGPVTVSNDLDCIISASGGYSLASPVGITCLVILLLLLMVAVGVFMKCNGNKGNKDIHTETKNKEMAVYTQVDSNQEQQPV